MQLLTLRTLFLLLCVQNIGQSPFTAAQCLTHHDDAMSRPDSDLSGIQDFNIDLFKRVLPTDPVKNLVFSPYSVWNSLVLAYFGSSGQTEEQFKLVLRVDDKINTLRKWRHLETLYYMRPETSVLNTFVLSNRVYFDSSVILRSCIQNILHNEVQQLDFMNDPHSAADTVNQFVSETTRGHIKQMVSPVDVMFSHMVLINAAFFKGTWVAPFDPEFTTESPFETLTGHKINVPMMSQFGNVNYGYNDTTETEIVGLPYNGETISMYILLPYSRGKENFDRMIAHLDSGAVDAMISSMYATKMQVFIPKFSLESVLEHELVEALSQMGLRDPFIGTRANFTDFSFDLDLSLDRGIHKAFIDVNEEGTEAGAATAFIANKIGGNSMFVCNRPFIFFIRDDHTKNILFMGAFKSPPNPKPSPFIISSASPGGVKG